MLRNLLINI